MLNVKLDLKIVVGAILIAVLLVPTTFSALTSTSVISNSGTILQAANLVLTADGFNLLDPAGNKVYLRGVGIAGMAPDLILWGNGGGDNWGDQWQAADSQSVKDTFAVLSGTWHVNMIRLFFYPEWWWLDNVTPSVASGAGYSSTPVSTRQYIKDLATAAADYGIYLDMVPYSLTAQSGAFASDPYLSSGGAGSIPMMGQWNTVQQQFITDTGYSEQEFWSQFWASVANELKGYPNVIFEAWNEPDISSSVNVIPSGYLSYLTTMYNAIRGTGATNLIMMQWKMGWVPNGWGADLSWASQIKNATGNPTNVIYTTHFYYYSPSDVTRYWNQNETYSYNGGIPKTTLQLESDLQSLISSMGINAPLVINEEGSCRLSSYNVTNDYIWWNNLLQAQATLGIGMGAYYWLSDSGLGGVYSGNSLLSSGYSPNTMGQEYIDSYSP